MEIIFSTYKQLASFKIMKTTNWMKSKYMPYNLLKAYANGKLNFLNLIDFHRIAEVN